MCPDAVKDKEVKEEGDDYNDDFADDEGGDDENRAEESEGLSSLHLTFFVQNESSSGISMVLFVGYHNHTHCLWHSEILCSMNINN